MGELPPDLYEAFKNLPPDLLEKVKKTPPELLKRLSDSIKGQLLIEHIRKFQRESNVIPFPARRKSDNKDRHKG